MFSNQLSGVSHIEKKNLGLLLIIGWLYTLGIYLSNIFVNIFLWKQTEDLLLLALYNLSIYLAQTLIFVLLGKWAKRIDRVIILRAGIFVISVFFISVLLLSTKASDLYYVLGILIGTGYGLFWLAYNILMFEVTEPYTRDFFNGMFGALQSLSGIIGPVSAGWIITVLTGYKGYLTIFFISFVLFILAIICSIFLQRRSVEGDYNIKEVIKEGKRNRQWFWMLSAHMFQGIREGVFLFLIGLWVYVGTQSELIVGVYNMIYAIASFIMYQVVARIVRPDNRKILILVGSIFLFLSVFWLLISDQPLDFYIYAGVLGVFLPLFFAPFTSISYDVIGQARNARDYRVEYIIFRDIVLNSGRALSLILFIIGLNYVSSDDWMKYSVIIFGVGYFISGLIIFKIQKLNQHSYE
ncbi:MFS transporter [Piscibacillus halophilus]|uniref:MFS transporter, YQGE family, putative transporter n=1 Tax=Piscibacillus halophilus TaxID=571933 RepID=A0A1H9MCL0_9BACI|nr:MFS transporter [Piscibacillus halophilus]SER21362.1 MFS transporter, YQGE family, putative transporter [Piscibacillus halophilus]